MTNTESVPGSFRDPSGYLFFHGEELFRRVNDEYQPHYEKLIDSGLYNKLTARGLLIPHQELDPEAGPDGGAQHWKGAYKILKPERVSFISYPYEWSFSQLKAAALATLAIQKEALEHGMVLKDASAYNIQFHKGQVLLIDTLSLETYQDGGPWLAYRQFCQHFLAPLALMSHGDVRHGRLSSLYIDGIPLDLASKLLPFKTRLRYGLLTHLHLHAASLKRFSQARIQAKKTPPRMSAQSLKWINQSLLSVITGLDWNPGGSEWGDYYSDLSYSDEAQNHKLALVDRLLTETQPQSVWDLGANTGRFSRLASRKGIPTWAFDMDPACVEKNYLAVKQEKDANLVPLLMDLANPSSGLGWAHRERMSFSERGPADMVLALALIHHLAISNNVPFKDLASFFASLCRHLIIEFVAKEDIMVGKLLASRKDIFAGYSLAGFELEFSKFFEIHERVELKNSSRTIFLLESKGPP